MKQHTLTPESRRWRQARIPRKERMRLYAEIMDSVERRYSRIIIQDSSKWLKERGQQ